MKNLVNKNISGITAFGNLVEGKAGLTKRSYTTVYTNDGYVVKVKNSSIELI